MQVVTVHTDDEAPSRPEKCGAFMEHRPCVGLSGHPSGRYNPRAMARSQAVRAHFTNASNKVEVFAKSRGAD
jgi:hypothetical protein